jgi:putative endonuclease
MDCFVYVLGTRAGSRTLTYVGWSNDVMARLAKHNKGTGAKTTRGRTWQLLHSEWFPTRKEAMSREWFLKRDRKFRKKLAAKVKTAPKSKSKKTSKKTSKKKRAA